MIWRQPQIEHVRFARGHLNSINHAGFCAYFFMVHAVLAIHDESVESILLILTATDTSWAVHPLRIRFVVGEKQLRALWTIEKAIANGIFEDQVV